MNKTKHRLLIVEDDESLLDALASVLQADGFDILQARNLQEARETHRSRPADLVMLDVQLPDGNGLELLRELKQSAPATPVVMMSGATGLELAVEAMKNGAVDFLTKPLNPESLAKRLGAFLESEEDTTEVDDSIVSTSPEMRKVLKLIGTFAAADVNVLILGESGTGKELVARAIHRHSPRADGPFVEFDCSTVPGTLLDSQLFGHEKGAFTDARQSRPGHFEMADGGVLFLDEIGNLSFEAQAKLLRVLQEQKFYRVGGSKPIRVDVRVVAATNLDLESEILNKTFRDDLYYRLAEVTIRVPPLRYRTGDVELLTDYFVSEYNRSFRRRVRGISPEARATLGSYPWPGNIRELQNSVRAALLLCGDTIEQGDLPERIRRGAAQPEAAPAFGSPPSRAQPQDGGSQLDFRYPVALPREGDKLDLKSLSRDAKHELEKAIICALVDRYGYNKTQLAGILGLDYKVTLQKLKELGIELVSGRLTA